MNVKKYLTINLSEYAVKKIIAEHLKNEGYEVEIDDVRLSVGTKIEGYGMGEFETPYFKGAHVSIKQ